MEILAFQIFIGFTIILTGLIAKKHLAAVCLAWTAFTFLAVFAAPLLILQVVTIWGCFALFNSGETSERGKIPASSREMPDRAATPAHPGTAKAQGSANRAALLDRAVHASYQVAKALDDLDDYVTLQKDVQSATSELDLAIHAERALIETALKSSKRAREIEKQLEGSPVLTKYYDESKHKFEKIGREIKDELETDEKGISSVVSAAELLKFDFPPRNTNPKIADAIETKISTLKKERDSFLSDAVKEIWADDRLLTRFEERLREVGASEIFARLSLKAAAPAAPKSAPQGHPQRPTLNIPRSSSMGLQTLSDQERDARINALIDARRRDEEERRRHAATRGVATVSTGTNLHEPYGGTAIKMQAQARKIPFLIHFTRVENLRSIMEHGLGSLTALREKGIRPYVNDHQRLDGYPDAICLSIAHPNDRMLFKYQKENPDKDWVVLVLDVSILWTHNIAFCKNNAADHRIRTRPLAQRKEPSAFEAMFLPSDDAPSRGEQNLEPFDPTDVQAELLIFDRLPPELITSLVFSSSRAAERYKDCARGKPTAIDDGRGFFAARSFVRKSGWTYSAAASSRAVQRQQRARVEERLSAIESGKIKLTDIPF